MYNLYTFIYNLYTFTRHAQKIHNFLSIAYLYFFYDILIILQLNRKLHYRTIFQTDYMTLLMQGSKDIADAINRILCHIISKPVQLRFSACGREKDGKKKESFIDTNTYEIMKSIHNIYKDILFFLDIV